MNPGFIPSLLERIAAQRIQTANSINKTKEPIRHYSFAVDPSRQPAILRVRSRLYLEVFNEPYYPPAPVYRSALQHTRSAMKNMNKYNSMIKEAGIEINKIEDEEYEDDKEFALLSLSYLVEPANEAHSFLQAALTQLQTSYEFYTKAQRTPESLDDIEDHIFHAWLSLRE